ncbi:MAG: transcription-repair coupling factor [Bacilli bacterium]|nr:transcription-repair coupling factor [Bacilli bacterium]
MYVIDLLKNYEACKHLYKGVNVVTSFDSLLVVASFKKERKSIIVVENNLYKAQKLYDQISSLEDDCLFFPSDESFRIEAIASSPELLCQRIYVLNKLIENEKPYIIITHTASILRLLPLKQLFVDKCINLKINDEIKLNELITKLIDLGYNRVNKIEHSLEFALRGGVLDIYSVNYLNPIRIEFFGNEIDSIRFFDLNTYRSIESVSNIKIIPASDLVYRDYQSTLQTLNIENEEEKAQLLEKNSYATMYKYFSKFSDYHSILDYANDYLLVLSNYNMINENYQLLLNEAYEYLDNNANFTLLMDLTYCLSKAKKVSYIKTFSDSDRDIDFPLREVELSYGNGKKLQALVNEYLRNSKKIVLCVENNKQYEYLKSWLTEWDLAYKTTNFENKIDSNVSLCIFPLKEGFELVDENLIYLSSYEIFNINSRGKKSYTRYKDAVSLKSYDSLQKGDYVVHEIHGIGQYLGLETKVIDNIHKDYLKILYRNNDVIYVPLEQFRMIKKYVSKEGVVPRLNKVGSDEWKKTKTKIKNRIYDIAERLIDLYQKRVEKVGFAFNKDDEWQTQFENSFPYELTSDQKQSIKEIKEDMEQEYPMDRLLCGDVGFGKTEVAFCAAFKAIMSNKQVALLTPTTLLCKQHYENALERFKGFGINIAILSRFTKPSEEKLYLKGIKEGTIHLVIGTHRLLSSDIVFKDLGLLIVDEEQRFGVLHKEKIKELKNSIDVLTLSATPIPRTLQMSLLGIRNLSQINTPPSNRMPVQTYVLEKKDALIKDVIERELARNGQVFYLHNNISTIYEVANKISSSVKGSNVIVAHGKMTREEIEQSMLDFYNNLGNVLICTTIIESGIDVPNANTIIVDDADHFGLSQLYQIKGRVGRGDRLAYAYLFYRKNKNVNEIAFKRLKAIKEFAELGSGYKIAMRDLSIRGAGDILGAEQAGFIDTIGMDMYIELLKEAIEEKKTGLKHKDDEYKKIINVDAYIPNEFSNDDLDKISLYQKIEKVKTLKELSSLEEEMIDVYGKLTPPVKLLIEKRRLEITVKMSYIEDVIDTKEYYEVVYQERVSSIDGIGLKIFQKCMQLDPKITLQYKKNHIIVRLIKKEKWLNLASEVLLAINEIIKENE